MNQILSKLDPIVTKFGFDGIDNIEILKGPCGKVGVRPAHVALIVAFISLLSIVLGIAARFLSTFISIIIPAYKSIQAIETEGQNDDKQWLTYWILFSIITLADGTIGFVLEFIPFYHIIKLALFVALFHPQLNGAEKVYDKFVHPVYEKYHVAIDENIKKVTQKATQKAKDLQQQY